MQIVDVRTVQLANEMKYSRHQINECLKEEVTLMPVVAKGVELLQEWLAVEYESHKQTRLNQVKNLDLESMVIEVLALVAYCTKPELLVSVAAQLAGLLGFADKPEAVLTTAEMLCVLADTDAFDVCRKTDKSSWLVVSKMVISQELLARAAKSNILPPMICKPMELTHNKMSGYLTHNESVILGKGNHHEKEACLDVLNIQNSIQLSLNEDFLHATPMTDSSGDMDFISVSVELMTLMLAQGNKFYLTNRYDKRGRIYSMGYHINTQGSKYQKACLELANKEHITDAGMDWLYVDIANAYGLDKLIFEERVQWVKDNMDCLESAENPDNPAAYTKALMAFRDCQAGEPIGHLVALDACNSGLQLMSVLTGCYEGSGATGLIDPNSRSDAYSDVTSEMELQLKETMGFSRSTVKEGVVTAMYGSEAKPKELFGAGTKELEAFFAAVSKVAPGASSLLGILLNSWNPKAKEHSWEMADGFQVVCKVHKKKEVRLEVEELNNSSFTFTYYNNECKRDGKSNAANLIHSVDSLVLREMVRRCSYDLVATQKAEGILEISLLERELGACVEGTSVWSELYENTNMPVAKVLPELTFEIAATLSTEHLRKLKKMVNRMLVQDSFELVTIHDSFAAHPNNCTRVAECYKEILAEIDQSTMANDLLSQLYKEEVVFEKKSSDLYKHIEKSRYALS